MSAANGYCTQRPVGDFLAGVVEVEEHALVEQFFAHPPVKGFRKPVLGRLGWRDGVPFDAMILRPGRNGRGRQFRAVLTDDHGRTASPNDQRCPLTRDAASSDRGVKDRRQALAGDIVDLLEHTEAAARCSSTTTLA